MQAGARSPFKVTQMMNLNKLVLSKHRLKIEQIFFVIWDFSNSQTSIRLTFGWFSIDYTHADKMADSATVSTTDREMSTGGETVDELPEGGAKNVSDAEELKKAISDESTKVNEEAIEEVEEYVLKDETHEEENNQKEQETNGIGEKHPAEEKKEKEEKPGEKAADKSLGATVAKHYNNIPESGRHARTQSRIFHLRNFNNWVKSVLINEFLDKAKKTRRRYDEEINVLDIGCGKGGDLLKWQKGRVGHVICTDIAETSVEQCKERYNNMRRSQRQSGGYRESRERLFSIECFPADCTKVDISEQFRSKGMQLDLSSCQFAFHYSFESYEQADTMLKNACAHLRPGGYFIGTTPDANELVKNLRKAEGKSFGNDVYSIEFDSKDNFALFGAKYHFKLVDVVDCPEFLVHFKAVEKLAAKYNMKLVYKKNFRDLFNENCKDYRSLLHKMQALEPYPARRGWSLVSDIDSDYTHIKKYEEDVNSGKEKVLGTLTKDEWEVSGLYIAFAFEKMDPEETSKQEPKEKAQKRAAPSEHHDDKDDSEPPVKRSREVEQQEEHTETDQKEEQKEEQHQASGENQATTDVEMAPPSSENDAQIQECTDDQNAQAPATAESEPAEEPSEPPQEPEQSAE
eukprot:gene18982-20889_t